MDFVTTYKDEVYPWTKCIHGQKYILERLLDYETRNFSLFVKRST
jgi:hypothetical protein